MGKNKGKVKAAINKAKIKIKKVEDKIKQAGGTELAISAIIAFKK